MSSSRNIPIECTKRCFCHTMPSHATFLSRVIHLFCKALLLGQSDYIYLPLYWPVNQNQVFFMYNFMISNETHSLYIFISSQHLQVMCNNYGECACGKCVCNATSKFRGKFCEDCPVSNTTVE